MRQFPQILRHAIRITCRDPGFIAIAVLTLAVGIGAATAAMSVAASVLRNPLPVRDDSQLVLVTKTLSTGSTLVPFSYAEIAAWRGASRTLEDISGAQYDGAWPWPADLSGGPMMVTGTAVSGNFFEVLGIRPVIGRVLRSEDASAGGEVVAVIGYSLWRREFNGNPAILEQRLRLNGRPATIVGVAPEGFAFPDGADVWRPLEIAADTVNEGWFSLVARLRPGATLAQATKESAVLVERLRANAPKDQPRDLHIDVVRLKEAITGDVRPVLILFVTQPVFCSSSVLLMSRTCSCFAAQRASVRWRSASRSAQRGCG
jgi:putative ABC transport system permease protein